MAADDDIKEVLRALGRVEGQLIEIHRISERVNKLELWQSWLKGLWAALAAGYAWMFRDAYK